MKTGRWVIVVIFALLVMSIIIFQWLPFRFFDRAIPTERPPWNTFFPFLLLAKSILSSVNAILLMILLAVYIGIYRKTGSEFSIGLIIFSIALLLYSLTSNPLIQRLAGFRGSGLGPFMMLPDLFTCIASAILLYLSRQ